MTYSLSLVVNDPRIDQRIHKVADALRKYIGPVKYVGRALIDRDMDDEHYVLLDIKPSKGVSFYQMYARKAMRYIDAHHKEIQYIISNDPDTLLPALYAKRRYGIDYIYDAHELFDGTPELMHKPLKRWIWRMIEKRGAQAALLNITVNQSIQEILTRRTGREFYPVMNLPLYRKVSNDDNRIYDIIYIGALNPGRGLEFLPEILVRNSSWRAFVAGPGPLWDDLSHRVAALGVSDRFTMNSAISSDHVFQYLKKSRVGYNVLEMKSRNYQLSSSTKFFDFIQAEVPSVNSQGVEYQRVLARHPVGMAVNAYNIDAVESVLKELLGNNEVWTSAVRACQSAKKIFHWEHQMADFITFVENHLREKR